jgi:hypothetical protein
MVHLLISTRQIFLTDNQLCCIQQRGNSDAGRGKVMDAKERVSSISSCFYQFFVDRLDFIKANVNS